MPKGVYVRTKPVWNKGKKLGYVPSGAFKKGIVPWNKGKKLPELSGENSPTWKGGRHKNQGYVYILRPDHPYAKKNGYVAEHRLVLEKHLGRYLTKVESPHHINKVRDDNRIKNLMLLKTKAIHNKVDKGYKPKKGEIIHV